MPLRVYLLGQFSLQSEERPLELPSRPAQSLLAYLALTAGLTHRREKLAGLLWPDATESNARSYLRQALWRIRKALDAAGLDWQTYLRVDDVSVTLVRDSGYWLDAEAVLRDPVAHSIDELVDAVQLYRGELLPGFYDEWIEPERERLQTAFYQQINQLVERLLATGRWREAIKWSEEWLRLIHAPEPAYRALMRAHAGLGDLAMVCATYERCAAALERELSVKPSPETQQLFEQLRAGGSPVVSRLAMTDAPDPLLETLPTINPLAPAEPRAFVAREAELARLEQLLALALAGRGQVGFVVGEAGSGKTALLAAFAQQATAAHPELAVAGGHCNAQTGIGDPYLPFREILEGLTTDVDIYHISHSKAAARAGLHNRALPVAVQALVTSSPDLIGTLISGRALAQRAATQFGPATPEIARLEQLAGASRAASIAGLSVHQTDLFSQYARLLRLVSNQMPLLVIVDDLQWADRGSVSLLFHLARSLQRSRVLVLGAYRPEDVRTAPDGGRHPLEPVINELRRIYGDMTVDLSRAAGPAFVTALVDSEPNRLDASFKATLFRQTRGNPLFTVELLRGMADRGELVREAGGWWIEGPALDWERLPARVEAVVAERVERLEAPLRRILRVASVEGELFTAESVAHVCGLDERDLLEQLATGLDRRHRLVQPDKILQAGNRSLTTYRFRHILFQKYIYGTLDEVERIHLHGNVGRVLESLWAEHGEVGAVAPQLAHHFWLAKETSKAIHYLIQAGKHAVQLSAFHEGVGHLQEARALLPSLPPSAQHPAQEIELLLALALALQGTEGPLSAGVQQAYTRARALCRESGDMAGLAQIMSELAILHFVHAEYALAEDMACQALSLTHQFNDPLRKAVIHWVLGLVDFFTGHYTQAHAHFAQMLEQYDARQHHRYLLALHGADAGISALAYDACCLLCLGFPEQALAASQQALTLAREFNHSYSLADALVYGGCVFNDMQGDDAALQRCAVELFDLVTTRGPDPWSGAATFWRGQALVKDGRLAEGLVLMEQGIACEMSVGATLGLPTRYRILADANRLCGQLTESRQALDKAFALVAETGEHHGEAELYRSRARLLLSEGRKDAAAEDLLAAIQVARGQEAKLWELRAAMDLANLWANTPRAAEGLALVGDIYVRFTEGFASPDLRQARLLLQKSAGA